MAVPARLPSKVAPTTFSFFLRGTASGRKCDDFRLPEKMQKIHAFGLNRTFISS